MMAYKHIILSWSYCHFYTFLHYRFVLTDDNGPVKFWSAFL